LFDVNLYSSLLPPYTMKKVFKVLGILLCGVLLLAGAALAYVKLALPDVGPAPELRVEVTPERVRHGEYLANHVVACMDCHSKRDPALFTAPLTPGTLGRGGERFDQNMGFPGVFYSKNITPAGLKDWTDGEIYRAITTGVNKHGEAMFPIMPYKYYAQMDPEDVKDIIAYLRSIPAIESEIPASEPDFPMNFIHNTIPTPAQPQKRPDPNDEVAYGKYLAFAAACHECHTKPDAQGQKIAGMDWAGGWEFGVGPNAFCTSANLTPDNETGIGRWTKEAFVAKFRAFADSSYQPHPVRSGEFQTIMPWTMYGHMTEQDLGAIYAYLRTLKPIHNPITKFRTTVAAR
jgi:mono/diheme cytochrome c family protein